jgi:hypothetical protein
MRSILLADRAYAANFIISSAHETDMEVVTPPKRNRKEQRVCDLYKMRRLPENAFLSLKRRRGTAVRYAENTALLWAAAPNKAPCPAGHDTV